MKKILFLIVIALCCVNLNKVKADTINESVNKVHSESFLYGKDIKWEYAGDGIVRQMLGYNGQIMMVKLKFIQGAIGTPHTHYHTQVSYVISGKFEFTIGGIKKIVSKGDALYMEPNILHECKCIEDGILIDCFSPMRNDFLKKGTK